MKLSNRILHLMTWMVVTVSVVLGAFARSFELPEGADAGSVNASFNNGVLTVTIAKAESAKPRKIEVKVA